MRCEEREAMLKKPKPRKKKERKGKSRKYIKILLDLCRSEDAERRVVLCDDADLDAVLGHHALKAVFQRENRCVDRILHLHVFLVPLFQKRLGTVCSSTTHIVHDTKTKQQQVVVFEK